MQMMRSICRGENPIMIHISCLGRLTSGWPSYKLDGQRVVDKGTIVWKSVSTSSFSFEIIPLSSNVLIEENTGVRESWQQRKFGIIHNFPVSDLCQCFVINDGLFAPQQPNNTNVNQNQKSLVLKKTPCEAEITYDSCVVGSKYLTISETVIRYSELSSVSGWNSSVCFIFINILQ